jgi:hypothetical protein
MPDRPSAQSREPDRPELAEQGKASPAPAARERPLWRRILTPLALRVVGTVPADCLACGRHRPRRRGRDCQPGHQSGRTGRPGGTGSQRGGTASIGRRSAQATDLEKKPDAACLGSRRRSTAPADLQGVSAAPAPLANPGPALLTITTAATVTDIAYEVGANGVHVIVYVIPPAGCSTFGGRVFCRRGGESGTQARIEVNQRFCDGHFLCQPEVKTVPFASSRFASSSGGFHAEANFSMNPYHAGLAYNGLTASAAFPEVLLSAPRADTVLLAAYDLPSGYSYDWSPSPPLPGSGSEWDIHLTSAFTEGQMLSGTNYAAEDAANFRTFMAGALVALAGAAFLSAFQEVLARFARGRGGGGHAGGPGGGGGIGDRAGVRRRSSTVRAAAGPAGGDHDHLPIRASSKKIIQKCLHT